MDCGIIVSEFELQSFYYVHFRKNAPGKSKNPCSISFRLNSITTVLIEG